MLGAMDVSQTVELMKLDLTHRQSAWNLLKIYLGDVF